MMDGVVPETRAGSPDPLIRDSTDTHCPYCALQCGMTLVRDGDRLIVAARDFPTNKGGLCRKGWTSAELLTHPDRLTTPLMRATKEAPLLPVSWEVALSTIAAKLQAIKTAHGADAVALFGGGGLTNEKAYMLGKFARVALGTANIDYNGRFCMSSAAGAGQKAFGIDRGLPFPLEDIPGAETIMLIGGNPAETMPPIMQYFDEQQRRGGKLIVVDPRKSKTAATASLHLQVTPGTDAALANGMLHIALRDKLIDPAYIAARTTGFAELRQSLGAYWPDRVERITGVPALQIEAATRMLARPGGAMVLTARGPEQQSNGVNNVLSFINLLLALGKIGKPCSGYGTLTGQGNGQGGREHGQKADQLPGYRQINNAEHRAHVAGIWGIDPATLPKAGKSAYELLSSLGTDGGSKALLVFASNLVISAPNANLIIERLKALDLLVVCDPFLSETAALADIVLPVTQWAEEDGTMTNLEGRVLRRRRALDPPPGVRSDAQVLRDLADRLGRGAYFSDDPATIFAELRRASAGGLADYAGITYERVAAEEGVFWPCPEAGHPGTKRLFLDTFPTEDGRARFHAVQHKQPAEIPDDHYPFYLTTGRIMLHYQSGTQTRRVAALVEAEPQAFVEIHSDMAHGLGIREGDAVRLWTRRGEARAVARLSLDIRMDTLFMPFHWGDSACVNLLTNPVLDPVSKMPEFKVCAAAIERLAL